MLHLPRALSTARRQLHDEAEDDGDGRAAPEADGGVLWPLVCIYIYMLIYLLIY